MKLNSSDGNLGVVYPMGAFPRRMSVEPLIERLTSGRQIARVCYVGVDRARMNKVLASTSKIKGYPNG